MADGGSSPIDAKRLPAAFAIGIILVILGVIVVLFAIYSIVAWAVGAYSALGIVGGLLVMPVGILLLVIGGIMASLDIFMRVFGKKNKRLLY
ncbi:MAG: hypothetical protein FWH44_02425 [Methanomassiliicoccaceae archaeon]|nr:hypothetical protein [Methanomassiliicoccaceae archaeon]